MSYNAEIPWGEDPSRPERGRFMPSSLRNLFVSGTVVVGFLAVGLSAGRSAETNTEDEAAIRKLISAGDQKGGIEGMPQLPDTVFWTGEYKKPRIGSEKGELRKSGTESVLAKRVPGSAHMKTEPLRIVTSQSGDLAYEYSRFTFEYDQKDGAHVMFQAGLLRVWQKQGSEWKEAAVFARPYEP